MSSSDDDEIEVIDHQFQDFNQVSQKNDSTFSKIYRNFENSNTNINEEPVLKRPKIEVNNSISFYKDSEYCQILQTSHSSDKNNKKSNKETKNYSINPDREFIIPKIKNNFSDFVELNFQENATKWFNLFSTYRDVFYGNNFNSAETRRVYSAHVLNHCYAWHHIVKRNDMIVNKYRLARLNMMKMDELEKKKGQNSEGENPPPVKRSKNSSKNGGKGRTLGLDIDQSFTNEKLKENFDQDLPDYPSDLELKDQGITKPKVLILAPFKQHALEIISNFQELLKYQIPNQNERKFRSYHFHNKAKFQMEYENNQDFVAPYGKGNLDDDFKFGVQLRNKSIKLFSNFYKSDIIIASPLGLKKLLTNTQDQDNLDKIKSFDYDFLSSIQICVVDDIQDILMQNVENLLHILDHLNLKPREMKEEMTNINRIYAYQTEAFNENFRSNCSGKRQLIFTSSVITPLISTIFNKFSASNMGKVLLKRSDKDRKINNNHHGLVSKLQQPETTENPLIFLFKKLPLTKEVSESDLRLKNFVQKTLRDLKSMKSSQIIVYIPDTYDFIRLNKIMKKRFDNDPGDSYCTLTEEDSVTKRKESLRLFASGQAKICLITERFYYFYRKLPKNFSKVIFYGIPTFEQFFGDLCGSEDGRSINGGSITVKEDSFVHVYFTSRELELLAGLTGKEMALNMIKNKNKDHWYFNV